MFQRDWQIAQMTPGRHMLGVYLKAMGEAVGLADFLEEDPEESRPWLGFLDRSRASAPGAWNRGVRAPGRVFQGSLCLALAPCRRHKYQCGRARVLAAPGISSDSNDDASARKRHVTLQRALWMCGLVSIRATKIERAT